MLANALGVSYDGDRDIYEALGYKKDLTFNDYFLQYSRQDIAAAVIDRPVSATWRGPLALIESDDDNDTALEKGWEDLEKRLHLKKAFARLDRLTGIGEYGVMFLGFSDVDSAGKLDQPVTPTATLQLLYVRPLSEANATISQWETDPANERYGLPVMYSLTLVSHKGGNSQTLTVHYTRVLHIADSTLEGSIYGTPRLMAVFNRLTDLEKLTGGSAEMFWRGARPGYHGSIDPEMSMDDATKDSLRDQIDEYDHNMRRFLIGKGLDIKSLEQQIADPAAHVDIQIQMISAQTGIPKRILTGSERGELASSEDKDSWLQTIQTRREEFAEPTILYPFVDLMIKYKVLPAAIDSYTVKWEDLWSTSDKEKAEIGSIRAKSLQAYAANPYAGDILPMDAFLKYGLGLTDDQIELIQEQQEQAQREEEARNAQAELDQALLDEEAAALAAEQEPLDQQPPIGGANNAI
jgi:hypothetical protein